MAFSQSLEFGNSTFMNIENQVNNAISEKNKNVENKLDVIKESPTKNNKGHTTLWSKSRARLQDNSIKKKSFRKSKSDSKLPKLSIQENNENYSDFFRSEFTFTITDQTKISCDEKDSLMHVSQLERHLKEQLKNNCDAVSFIHVDQIKSQFIDQITLNNEVCNLNSPMFSDDLQQPLELSNLSNDNLLNGSINKTFKDILEDVEEIVQIDENSFLCPNRLKAESAEHYVAVNEDCDSKCPETVVIKTVKLQSNTNVDIESLKNISSWNLPNIVLSEYEKKGVIKMFDWQVECLSNPKVLFEHNNLVYSAPTSAGKTLVSEILLLKTVIERQKKVLLILPFISVVREKMFYLQDLLTPAGYRVEGFFGGYSPPGGFDSINVAICTIEKANSIVNKLLEQGRIDEIGTVVVDEVHLISDPGRGYILELLLAKILYMSRKYSFEIQVITMSATLANVQLLQRWLDAELFITDFRPVELKEMLKIGNQIYDSNMKLLRSISDEFFVGTNFPQLQKDGDHIAQLCIETILEGCSVIVFCPSKDWCENLAVQLASAIHILGKSGTENGNSLRTQLNREAIGDLKKQLRDIPTGLDAVLEKTITFACAFHHAGLTTEERDIIEANFKSGVLKIIVATSTLSSGVNLPARRVIIRSPLFGGKQMSSLTYKQMIGRAGRTGRDTLGESILICTDGNARVGRELVTAAIKPIYSCLEMDSNSHLKRALLEVISAGVVSTKEDIESFFNCTLLSAQKQTEINTDNTDDMDTKNLYINESLKFLIEYEFLRLQKNEETKETIYVATRLGSACLASSMPPTDGLLLFAELQKARRCFVLESDLHAVYLVTPYSVCYQLQDLDWLLFLDLWEKLSPSMKKVGELVGVKESFLVRAMRGQTKLDYKLIQIHKRFYTSLALQELVNEIPINIVATKYKCNRGMLQGLQQMASTFAGIVTAFCNSLQWATLSLIVSQFKERLYFGIHHDLIDLMRLPNLTQKRARSLFDAGITKLVELANTDIVSLEKILYNSLSFDSEKPHENEGLYDAEQRKSKRNFFITGRAGMTVGEAAKMLVFEARQFVQYEIGVNNIQWSQDAKSSGLCPENEDIHMSCEEEHCTTSKRISPRIKEIESTSAKIFKLSEELNACPQSNSDVPINIQEEESLATKNHQKLSKDIGSNVPNKLKTCSANIQECVVNYTAELPIINKTKEQGLLNIQNKPNEIKCEISPTKNRMLNKNCKNLQLSPAQNLSSGIFQAQNEKESKAIKQLACNQSPDKEKMQQASRKEHTKSDCIDINIGSHKITDNEKPCTSRESRKIFLDEKRKQALILKNKRVAQFERNILRVAPEPSATTENNNNQIRIKTTANKENFKQNCEENFMDEKRQGTPRIDNIKIDNKIELKNESPFTTPKPTRILKNTNKISSVINSAKTNSPDATKMPRRSPRNHGKSISPRQQISNIYLKKTIDTEELFMDDESFELNSEINYALKTADDKVNCQKEKQSLFADHKMMNKSNDEIPGSQQLQGLSTNNTCSPLVSRSLRSNHTEHGVKTNLKPNHATNIITDKSNKSPPQNSISIALSDLSCDNSIIKNPLYLNASHILSCSKIDTDASNFKCIEIVDICGNQELFKSAFKEILSAKRFGFSIGLQQQSGKQKPLIGGGLLINQISTVKDAPNTIQPLYKIDDSAFIEGIAFCLAENIVYYMNMQAAGSCKGLTPEIKSKYLRKLLNSADSTIIIFDSKEQLKILQMAIPNLGEIKISLEDPKVANWLLQPDTVANMHLLTKQFAPECTALASLCGKGRGYNSFGTDYQNAILSKVRCSIESCVTLHILKGQIENLERIGNGQLHKFFVELEMPLQLLLCNMEVYGFAVNEKAMQDLYQKMVNTMKKLESKIFEMHGSRFNLGSSSAVARVVGLHRKSNGRISTSRQILEKLDTPISQMIINYRKLSTTLAKNIQPLLKCIKSSRIHGQSITFTSTGRISMVDPNLQNVAKDFNVDLGSEKVTISCRSVFYQNDDKRCLISSDFCQLEMRILAHLSQDSSLLEVMTSDKDVFTTIAARWNKVPEDKVSEQLRNGTKQICYGIVYGMGMRSLAESLKCTEQEAVMVSEQFHAVYAGIRLYADKVVKFARNNGYIETITGRRRYLEHINSGELQMKSQAERQAINSTIQGSAADIAKSAILRIEKNIFKYREKLGLDANSVRLVLHIHDELIFEVPTEKAKKIAKVLSVTMENCVKLNVPLKVKLKMGKSWGELKEIKI